MEIDSDGEFDKNHSITSVVYKQAVLLNRITYLSMAVRDAVMFRYCSDNWISPSVLYSRVVVALVEP